MSRPKFGQVNVALATARAKIEQCEKFERQLKIQPQREITYQ